VGDAQYAPVQIDVGPLQTLVAYRGLSGELRSWIAVLGFSPDGRGKVDTGSKSDERDKEGRRLLS
jgi:hypothetical protein